MSAWFWLHARLLLVHSDGHQSTKPLSPGSVKVSLHCPGTSVVSIRPKARSFASLWAEDQKSRSKCSPHHPPNLPSVFVFVFWNPELPVQPCRQLNQTLLGFPLSRCADTTRSHTANAVSQVSHREELERTGWVCIPPLCWWMAHHPQGRWFSAKISCRFLQCLRGYPPETVTPPQ